MNEELQQSLTDLINKSMELGGDALAFTQEQLPDVIQQLLLWKALVSFIWFAVWLGLFLIPALFAKKLWAWGMRYGDDSEGFSVFCVIVIYIAGGVSLFLSANQLDWLQIWIAPKVYLLEYAANMVK